MAGRSGAVPASSLPQPSAARPSAARPSAARPSLAWAGYGAAALALLAAPVHAYHAVEPGGAVLARAGHLGAVAVLLGIAALAVALAHPVGRRLPTGALIVPAFVVCVGVLSYAVGLFVDAGHAVAAAVGPAVLPDAVVPDAVVPDAAVARAVDAAADVAADAAAGIADTATAALHPTRAEHAVVDCARWLGSQALTTYPLVGWTATVLWALALGGLLAAAAAYRLGGPTARRIWVVVLALGVLRLTG